MARKKDDKPDPFRGLQPLDGPNIDRFMECPPERHIESLVLGRIPPDKRKMLHIHLKYCFTCYELFTDFKAFYTGSKMEFWRRGALPGMANPLPEPFSDQIVHILPHDVAWPWDESPEDDYQRLSTLCSSDGRLQGAFLLMRNTDAVLVALRMSDGRRLSNVPFQVPKFPEKFITDSSGIAVIGKYDPSLFLDTRLKIYLPLIDVTTHVGSELIEEEQFSPEPIPGFPLESIIVYVDDDFTLCLELEFGAENIDHPLTAVFIARGETRMIPVSDRTAQFPRAPLGTPIQILVFPF